MSAVFVVFLPAPDADAIHRNRDFAEDLDGVLRGPGHGNVIAPDDVEGEVLVATRARARGEVVRCIDRALRRHRLERTATVEGVR
jgi:hypothetical protein